MRLGFVFSLLCAAVAQAQLVAPNAIPKGPNPPVVFLNGYQDTCPSGGFASTFGSFDQILQAANRPTVFFDNCAFPNKPAIEDLGNGLASFFSSLMHTDGSPVTQVDAVAHSMGGLILRSYLAGKLTDGTFKPPLSVPIRKAVYLGTPHFGSAATFGTSIDKQVAALNLGSQFTFDLATWNQGTDDLRGVDSIAVLGNAGNGFLNTAAFDDGVVSLSSGSLGFVLPNRTRIINACHTTGITQALLCNPGAPLLAKVNAASDLSAAAVLSFLADTPDWRNIGQAPEANSFLSTGGGLTLRARSPDGKPLTIDKAVATKNLNLRDGQVAYTELLNAGSQPVTVTSGATTIQNTVNVGAGYTNARVVKDGPQISRVLPSAAAVFPLQVAANSYVSIYGSNFATGTTVSSTNPLPTMLAGVQVLADGRPFPLLAVTPNQVNVIFPAIPGVNSASSTITVMTPGGATTVNVVSTSALPTLFTQNGTGSGPASALNAISLSLVTPTAPLHAGDYVALYLTGLPAVIPAFTATVSVAGQDCPVQYAGVAPGYTALDQINCQIPSGLAPSAAAPVIATVAGVVSNTATLAIQ